MVEVLIAISINLLVIVMIMGVVLPGLRHIYMIKNERDLHATTQSLANQFSYLIKQGADIEVGPANPGNELIIHFIGSPSKTITQNGDNIVIIEGVDENSLLANNIIVEDLEFTKMDRSVRIEFALKINGADDSFSATTTVAQRNSL